mmetsp:Transcript_7759/g.18781  ORF Transcript_7759/g.18781 Transcript_7759/m.18781 type:complete len:198 (+) Transcript_7759:392-985(+)
MAFLLRQKLASLFQAKAAPAETPLESPCVSPELSEPDGEQQPLDSARPPAAGFAGVAPADGAASVPHPQGAAASLPSERDLVGEQGESDLRFQSTSSEPPGWEERVGGEGFASPSTTAGKTHAATLLLSSSSASSNDTTVGGSSAGDRSASKESVCSSGVAAGPFDSTDAQQAPSGVADSNAALVTGTEFFAVGTAL